MKRLLCKFFGHQWKPRLFGAIRQDYEMQRCKPTPVSLVHCKRCGALTP